MPHPQLVRRLGLVVAIVIAGLVLFLGHSHSVKTETAQESSAATVRDASRYPLTIASLQARYREEMQAKHKYTAYGVKARAEDYPHIAYLFDSLSYSEFVHARNFARQLTDLGVDVEPLPRFKFEVLKTKDNVKHATAVEMDEIAHRYPDILKEIKGEQHEEAIQFMTYAWESERQHRDLLQKIQKAAKKYFGMLAAHIESEAAHYYVCEVCGSTLTELPTESCPICTHPAKHYIEVPGFPGVKEEDDW